METSFKLVSGEELVFTNFKNRLLFLHTDTMSAQLVLNDIGVQIQRQPKNIKVGFLSTKSEAYHSFYFMLDEYFKLRNFFKLLNFPLDSKKEMI